MTPLLETLTVTQIIQRTYNVKSFRFALGEGAPSYMAGQFLCAHTLSEKDCKRYLSISSSPTEKGYIEFTKKITQSDFSLALEKLKPGDGLNIEYPFGKFTLDDNFPKVAFLSGGIGITPIRSMCKYAIDNKLNIDMVLVYANRSIRDVVFKDDFDAMQKEFPLLKVAHVLCEPAPGFKCTIGLINAQIIRNEIPDLLKRRFYLCGPPAMVEAMKKILLEELSVARENIITENFAGY